MKIRVDCRYWSHAWSITMWGHNVIEKLFKSSLVKVNCKLSEDPECLVLMDHSWYRWPISRTLRCLAMRWSHHQSATSLTSGYDSTQSPDTGDRHPSLPSLWTRYLSIPVCRPSAIISWCYRTYTARCVIACIHGTIPSSVRLSVWSVCDAVHCG